MSERLNRRVVRWFDEGHFVEALLGAEPDFFIRCRLWGIHDRMVVAVTLLEWASTDARRVAARDGLERALSIAAADGDDESVADIAYCLLTPLAEHVETAAFLFGGEVGERVRRLGEAPFQSRRVELLMPGILERLDEVLNAASGPEH